jgi:hypothetical protein
MRRDGETCTYMGEVEMYSRIQSENINRRDLLKELGKDGV